MKRIHKHTMNTQAYNAHVAIDFYFWSKICVFIKIGKYLPSLIFNTYVQIPPQIKYLRSKYPLKFNT